MSPAARKRISAAMKQRWANWKGEVCTEAGKGGVEESHRSPSHERSRQEEVVGFDEGPLGGEEENASIILALPARSRCHYSPITLELSPWPESETAIPARHPGDSFFESRELFRRHRLGHRT